MAFFFPNEQTVFMLIDELRNIRCGRKNHKKDTYRHVYALARDRVRMIAQGTPGGHRRVCCTYMIPVWLPGRPLYDPTKVAQWVARKLKKQGLDVHADPQNPLHLYIAWSTESSTHNHTHPETLMLHQLAR